MVQVLVRVLNVLKEAHPQASDIFGASWHEIVLIALQNTLLFEKLGSANKVLCQLVSLLLGLLFVLIEVVLHIVKLVFKVLDDAPDI